MSKDEELRAAEEAKMAAELAHANIRRFLDLQGERESSLIMKAHEQQVQDAARAAGAAAELAALNIRRFLELQRGREASLIMQAHQARDAEKGRKG